VRPPRVSAATRSSSTTWPSSPARRPTISWRPDGRRSSPCPGCGAARRETCSRLTTHWRGAPLIRDPGLSSQTGVPRLQRITSSAFTRVFDALWCCAARGKRGSRRRLKLPLHVGDILQGRQASFIAETLHLERRRRAREGEMVLPALLRAGEAGIHI